MYAAEPPRADGAASPPVEARIYDSDVVVRATLLPGDSYPVRFKVIEYLKGTGPAEITVNAQRYGKDGHEAALFLSRTSPGESGASSSEFVFTEAHFRKPGGHTVDSLDPAWLPATTPTGASANASDTVYITDSGVATGGSQETISLSALKAKIAWIEGGENVGGYDECLNRAIGYLENLRDYEAYYGRSRPINETTEPLNSGVGAGRVLHEYGPYREAGYSLIWLTGQDADLFTAEIVDDNKSSTDGYKERVATVRPLPAGVYRFRDHGILYHYIPCGFNPKEGTGQLDWTVTVTAPAGTLHELFFDPVTGGQRRCRGRRQWYAEAIRVHGRGRHVGYHREDSV